MNIFINFRITVLLLLVFPVCFYGQTVADASPIDYFSYFSSTDDQIRIEAAEKFKQEPTEAKTIILRKLYIENTELVKSKSLQDLLIKSAQLLDLSKYEMIENDLFSHIEKTIESITKNKNIQFEFDDGKRAAFYIRLLAAEGIDSSRLFFNIVSLIKLGDNPMFTFDELESLLLEIPYKSDNNYVAELIDAFPYSHNIYTLEKIFNRFVSAQNKDRVIEKISPHITFLKAIDAENKIRGKNENLSEKINHLEKITNDYNSKFPYSHSPENQIHSLFSDFGDTATKLNMENSIPTFYSELPIQGLATNDNITDQQKLAAY